MSTKNTAADILRNTYKKEVSEHGAACAQLISDWRGGLHHFPGGEKEIHRVDWDHPHFVRLRVSFEVATSDVGKLTHLVFLAHDHGVRVSIGPLSQRNMEVYLHAKPSRGHPTLEEAVAKHRRHYPKEVP